MQTVCPNVDRMVTLPQRAEINDALGSQDIQFHQIEQRRAAGQKLDRRVGLALPGAESSPRCLDRIPCPFIGERPHYGVPTWSRACFIAATIFGYAAHRHRLPLIYSRMS